MKNVLNSFYSQIIIAIAAIILIFACTQEATEPNTQYFDLFGSVVDEAGDAIPGAVVYGLDEVNKVLASDTTDADGNFLLRNVPEDLKNYYLKVEIEGEVLMSSKLSEIYDKEKLQNKSKVKITIQQEGDCCNFYMITVIDSEGNAVKDADVWARKGMNDTLSRGETDENGKYGYFEICKNSFEVRIAKEGYKVVEKLIENKLNCDTLNYEIKLYEKDDDDECCDGSIKVWVQNESGEKIKNAEVRLWKDGKKIESGKSEDGYVYFDDLCEGKYGISIFADNYKEIEFNVELGCNEQKVIEKKLVKKSEESCCNAVIVKVQDEEGNPIKDAEVKLQQFEGEYKKILKTDADGKVGFYSLCNGKYWTRIFVKGFEVKEEDFTFDGKCDTLTIIQKLEKDDDDECCDGSIKVWVQNESGEKIKNAEVRLWKDGKKIESGKSVDGYVYFDDLCEGKYGISIFADNYKEIEFNVELGCNEQKVIEKKLVKNGDEPCCDSQLKIFPKDKVSKETIAGATVIIKLDGKVIGEHTLSAEETYAEFEDLCEGKYTIYVKHSEYEPTQFEMKIGCDKEVQETAWLQPK